MKAGAIERSTADTYLAGARERLRARALRPWTVGERDRLRRVRWTLAAIVGLGLAVGIGFVLPT